MRRWLESSASSCSLQAWPKEKRSPWFGRLSCECRTWWATSLSVLFHFKLLFLHCFIGPLIAWRHNFKCICRQQHLHIHQQPIRSVKPTFIMIKQRNHVGMLTREQLFLNWNMSSCLLSSTVFHHAWLSSLQCLISNCDTIYLQSSTINVQIPVELDL